MENLNTIKPYVSISLIRNITKLHLGDIDLELFVLFHKSLINGKKLKIILRWL